MIYKAFFFKIVMCGFFLITNLAGNVDQKKFLLNRDEVSTNLKNLLYYIHDFYESEFYFGAVDQKDLSSIKKIIRGFSMANMNWLDLDIKKSNPNLNYLFESSNPEERELGLYIIGISIISNENPDPCDCFILDVNNNDKMNFFNSCLMLAHDLNINVERAAYDFLSVYIPKHKELYDANEKILSGIINSSLLFKMDAFIRNCAFKIKQRDFLDMEYSLNEQDSEFYKISNFFEQSYLEEEVAHEAIRCVNSGKIHLQHKGLCILKQLVQNNFAGKDTLQAINKCIPNIYNKIIFKDLIKLINSLVDKNIEINSIIDIVSKIELVDCNFDLDGTLIDLYVDLTKFPAFLKHGLKIICRYNSLGGSFSYGGAFKCLIADFVENYIKANFNIEELRKFAEKCINDYECPGSLNLGIDIYECLVNKSVCFSECSNFIKCMRKKDTKLNGMLWSLYAALVQKNFAVKDAIEYANYLMNKCEDHYLAQAASLFDNLVLNGYARDYANKCLNKMEKIKSDDFKDDIKCLKNVLNKN